MVSNRTSSSSLSLAACICVLAAGCYTGAAHDVSPERIAAEPGWLVVHGVSFVPQQNDDDCGAAALAMVLTYDRVPTSREAVLAGVHPRDGGITAGELRDVARAQGLQAFVLKADWTDLEEQLRRGRPLVVGLRKPVLAERTVAHFEVVIGFHRAKRLVLTLDPARGLREISAEGFAREWAPAGQVALFVLPPPAPPPQPSPPGAQDPPRAAYAPRLASSSAHRS